MESSRNEPQMPINRNAEAFLKMLGSSEQLRVAASFVANGGKLDDKSPIINNGVKYVELMLILADYQARNFIYNDQVTLVPLHLLYTLTNDAEMIQKAYELAKKQKDSFAEHDLLPFCAINASVENFNIICDCLELKRDSDEYKKRLTQSDYSLQLPIAPLYIAAYSGNLALLKDMCTVLDRQDIVELETSSGLSLLHFAAMGGCEEVVDYLVKTHKMSLDTKSRKNISPFAYTSLSNEPAVVKKFIGLGYKPTPNDEKHYRDFYLQNGVTIFRALRSPGQSYTQIMLHVLKEVMQDPLIQAIRVAKQNIDETISNNIILLAELLQAGSESTREIMEAILSELRKEILSYSHLTIDPAFTQYLNEQLKKLEEVEATFSKLFTKPQPTKDSFSLPSSSRASVSQPSPSSQPTSSSPLTSSTQKIAAQLEWEQRRNWQQTTRNISNAQSTSVRSPAPSIALHSDNVNLVVDAPKDKLDNVAHIENEEEKESPRPSWQ